MRSRWTGSEALSTITPTIHAALGWLSARLLADVRWRRPQDDFRRRRRGHAVLSASGAVMPSRNAAGSHCRCDSEWDHAYERTSLSDLR
jgi:hypothetical protein